MLRGYSVMVMIECRPEICTGCSLNPRLTLKRAHWLRAGCWGSLWQCGPENLQAIVTHLGTKRDHLNGRSGHTPSPLPVPDRRLAGTSVERLHLAVWRLRGVGFHRPGGAIRSLAPQRPSVPFRPFAADDAILIRQLSRIPFKRM